MSIFNKKIPESPMDLARAHLMHARRNMLAGQYDAAEKDISNSKVYAGLHAKKLAQAGKHDEAKQQIESHQQLITHIKAMRPVAKTDGANDMEKIDPASSKGESVARREYMSTGSVKPTMQVARPGQDPRYNYKPLHELSHADQIKAHHQYQSRDMTRHSYPVDKKTGELVVARRSFMPESSQPQPKAASYAAPKPEHREGSSVRIHAPGSPYHGKLGVVRLPHPSMPDKVPVQVGSKAHDVIYVGHHEVKPSRPSTKIEKALVSYLNIQKALTKI